jgi:hypothetical protein
MAKELKAKHRLNVLTNQAIGVNRQALLNNAALTKL